MKLIPMTDFVIKQINLLYNYNHYKLIYRVMNYAEFLKQPLTLDMFIGDKALFEKIHESDNFWCGAMIENQTIEDLLKDDINFILTPYAITQLGL